MPVMDNAVDVSSTMMDVSRRIYSGGCGSNHNYLHKKRIGELRAACCVLLNQLCAACFVLQLRAADSLCIRGLQCRFGRHLRSRNLSYRSTSCEKAEVAAKRYSATSSLRDLATAAQIQPSDLDGSTCDTRTFLTNCKFDPWNGAAVIKWHPLAAADYEVTRALLMPL